MADQFNPTLEYLDFPDLAKGMSTEAPARSLVPGNGSAALFRDVTNMVRDHGMLGSWYGIYLPDEFAANFPTIERNGTWFSTAPNGLLNGQCPMWMFFDFPQTWNKAGTTTQSTYGSFMAIVVTSREIFIYSPQDHVWYNATPVYSGDAAGATVDVSAGGTVTVNAGASPWLSRKIVPGQLIKFAGDANWYSINSVLGGPDRLTTNFAGVAKVNVAYTIRRCFGGRNYSHGDNLLYARIFNGDLYVAGRTLAGAGVGPAVIRVNNVYDNVYTTEYLLAAYELKTNPATALSMTLNGSVVPDLWDIKGMQILPDGRVVIATSEIPPASLINIAKTGIVGNRLRYSSNVGTGNVAAGSVVTAQQIWNASPAGFIDVVDHEGEISALGKLGPSTLTIHFHRGVSLGTYTAQYDPPLSIQATAAKVGCLAPRTLSLHGGTEFFLGSDAKVHAFDGEKTTALTDETLNLQHDSSDNTNSAFLIANCHACVDTRKEYYRLFFCDNNFELVDAVPAAYADYTQKTTCWLLSLEDGALFKETYSPHITVCSEHAVGSASAALGTYIPATIGGNAGTLLIGLGTMNPAGTKQCGNDCIMALAEAPNIAGREPNAVLYRAYYTSSGSVYTETPAASFETDDLDFGKPGVDKTLDHIIAWFSAADGVPGLAEIDVASMIVISVSTTSGASWTALPTATSRSYPYGLEVQFRFDWSPIAAEKFRFRVMRTATAGGAGERGMELRVLRMRIYYQVQAENESVNPDL